MSGRICNHRPLFLRSGTRIQLHVYANTSFSTLEICFFLTSSFAILFSLYYGLQCMAFLPCSAQIGYFLWNRSHYRHSPPLFYPHTANLPCIPSSFTTSSITMRIHCLGILLIPMDLCSRLVFPLVSFPFVS